MKYLVLVLSIVTVFCGCKKDSVDNSNDNPNNPVNLNTSINRVFSKSAVVDGYVLYDGGHSVTERGICYSTSSSPTTANNKISNGNGEGTYSTIVPGLSPTSTYYARAYAINDIGTVYGNEINFTTEADLESVQIGTQVWTAKNLNVDYFKNGEFIPNVQENVFWAQLNSASGCWWQNNLSYGVQYGKLYNWYAVIDPRGLAPEGWHIPTETEWNTLINYLGGTTVAGGKLKEAGNSHWQAPNTGADNSSGFTGLPGSCRNGDFTGEFPYSIGEDGLWWSATEISNQAKCFLLSKDNASIFNALSNKQSGFAIRCVKD
ncbi:MAG: fibrobacter succinogenes major paralogous domain-containing protein [Ferruginibacter sp.]